MKVQFLLESFVRGNSQKLIANMGRSRFVEQTKNVLTVFLKCINRLTFTKLSIKVTHRKDNTRKHDFISQMLALFENKVLNTACSSLKNNVFYIISF